MGAVTQGFEHGAVTADFGHPGVKAGFSGLFKIDKLVDEHLLNQRTVNAVKSVRALLPAFDVFRLGVPEASRQHQRSGIQHFVITKGLVVLVVFCCKSQRSRLDAHVDVLGDQHDLAFRMVFFQRCHHPQNLVVCLALGQSLHGKVVVEQPGLEEQAPDGFLVAQGIKRQAIDQFLLGHGGHEGVKHPAGLSHIARNLIGAFLVAVHFLQNDQGQVNVVFFKTEEAGRIVHQHVGVKHKQLAGIG